MFCEIVSCGYLVWRRGLCCLCNFELHRVDSEGGESRKRYAFAVSYACRYLIFVKE